MSKNLEIVKQAVKVLKIEAEGILKLAERIDENFSDMVDLISGTTGRLIVSGIGKSGIVARKIVATLNSTGTRSLFLHPVEAMHGDLGIVSIDDIFLAISNSGETDELNILLPSIKKIGCKIIAFTGNLKSTLSKNSDIVIDTKVDKEACPLGLAPTSSTTAQLAMGDALAVVLINKKEFNSKDFKKNHPGGLLGRRLARKVKDIMLTGDNIPKVIKNASMEEAIKEMERRQLGVTLVVDHDNILAGIITDGDLRRLVALKIPVFEKRVDLVMTKKPKTIGPNFAAYDALNLMELRQITVLPITNRSKKVLGILHLHDILGKGEFKFNP